MWPLSWPLYVVIHHLDDDARHVREEESHKDEGHHPRQPLLRLPDPLGQSHLGVPHLKLHVFSDRANLHRVEMLRTKNEAVGPTCVLYIPCMYLSMDKFVDAKSTKLGREWDHAFYNISLYIF